MDKKGVKKEIGTSWPIIKACIASQGLSLIHIWVVLRDMFTREEALKLKETEQYEKDKHLRQAVDYVLDKVAIK